MKIQLTLTIEIEDYFINWKDKEERDWLFNELLKDEKELYIHSNVIGDELGKIIKLENVKEIL